MTIYNLVILWTKERICSVYNYSTYEKAVKSAMKILTDLYGTDGDGPRFFRDGVMYSLKDIKEQMEAEGWYGCDKIECSVPCQEDCFEMFILDNKLE